jgi:hypothetical protein
LGFVEGVIVLWEWEMGVNGTVRVACIHFLFVEIPEPCDIIVMAALTFQLLNHYFFLAQFMAEFYSGVIYDVNTRCR